MLLGKRELMLKTHRSQPVTILEVGSEGGSVSLLAKIDSDGKWIFRVTNDESSLADLLDEPDLKEHSYGQTEWVSSWDQALSLMDKYPWPRLCPVVIHESFVRQIAEALQARTGENPVTNRRWRRVLEASGWRSAEGGKQAY